MPPILSFFCFVPLCSFAIHRTQILKIIFRREWLRVQSLSRIFGWESQRQFIFGRTLDFIDIIIDHKRGRCVSHLFFINRLSELARFTYKIVNYFCIFSQLLYLPSKLHHLNFDIMYHCLLMLNTVLKYSDVLLILFWWFSLFMLNLSYFILKKLYFISFQYQYFIFGKLVSIWVEGIDGGWLILYFDILHLKFCNSTFKWCLFCYVQHIIF